LLFRDEGEVDHWCSREGIPKGTVVPTQQFWSLARVWYEGRLELEWSPRSVSDAQTLLESVGLTGDFWRLTP